MPRGAPLQVVNDETPLDGREIDVGARIGWVLRMARQLTPDGPPPLEAMASELRTSAARLHRLETGQLRDGRLIDGYERLLHRPEGSLRAPVDVLCRTFNSSSPADRDPGPRATTVAEMSALTETVASGVADGGGWLRWARSLSQPGAIGMPEALAAELVGRLISELNRAVGVGYPSRYEALAQLRSGAYSATVLHVASQAVGDRHVQVLFDMMSAVGEAFTPDAIEWCVDLLDDERDRVVIGAALALENMGQIAANPSFWEPLIDPLTERFNATGPGTDRWLWLSHLLRLAPHPQRAHARVRPGQRLAPSARIDNWSRTRLNGHWVDCERRAHVVTETASIPDQPMLARFLFDIAISPYESRAVTSYMLLGAMPELTGALGQQLADIAEHHIDPVIRDRTGRRLLGTSHGELPPVARRWLHGSDIQSRNQALMLAGAAGAQVQDHVVLAAIEQDAASRHAGLYAVGMTGHQLARTLVSHSNEDIAGGARWWVRHGCRVVDEDAPRRAAGGAADGCASGSA